MQPTDFQTEQQVLSYFNDLINPAIKSQNWNTVLSLTDVFMHPNSHAHFTNIGQSERMTIGMYHRATTLAVLGRFLESNQLLIICKPRFVQEGKFNFVRDSDELFSNNNLVLNNDSNYQTLNNQQQKPVKDVRKKPTLNKTGKRLLNNYKEVQKTRAKIRRWSYIMATILIGFMTLTNNWFI